MFGNLEKDVINLDDFSQDKLIAGMQNLVVKDGSNSVKAIRVKGYQLPGYSSFDIREFGESWILSIGGKLVSYGSYKHIADVMVMLVTVFKCWDSKASLIYFLQLEEHANIIEKIIKLRDLDHNKKG